MTHQEYQEKFDSLHEGHIKVRKRYEKLQNGALIVFTTAFPAIAATLGLMVGGGVTCQEAIADAQNSQEYIKEVSEAIEQSTYTYQQNGDFDAFKDQVNYYRSDESVEDYILKNDSLEVYGRYTAGKNTFLSGIATAVYTFVALGGSLLFSNKISKKYDAEQSAIGYELLRLNEEYMKNPENDENE